ncbi:MAG TPA: alpha/beta hydrolase [Vicinamibacterales bacterium]|nr:alpha/beta hydrolase [Vicinamibacterales bacterium]
MADLNRRDWLAAVGALGAVAGLGGRVSAGTAQTAPQAAAPPPPAPSDTTRFFPGFKSFKVQTSGAVINGVIGGQGPPVLLLHGAPLTHVTWRLVAPKLAATHTVVVPDLRGYGDSSKPPDGDNHANYSKRAMALDQVEVMRHFGFTTFPVIGQDRGGRVAQRMALDHADKVTHLAVLDIVPTYYLYTHVTLEFVQAYYHWFSYLRRAPIPENELKAANDRALERATSDVQREYLRTMTDPATIHAMCEDYRAGASIDLKHDEADLHVKITCPLRVLWAEKGAMGRLYDVMAIWRERGTNVTGRALPGGHNLQEDVPDLVLEEILSLVRSA